MMSVAQWENRKWVRSTISTSSFGRDCGEDDDSNGRDNFGDQAAMQGDLYSHIDLLLNHPANHFFSNDHTGPQ